MRNVNQRLIRKIHKWVMWLIGIQFLIWCLSGLYFSSFDIHDIHGEPLENPRYANVDINSVNFRFSDVLTHFPDAQNLTLYSLGTTTVYRFHSEYLNKTVLLNARTGEPIQGINEPLARDIATKAFTGNSDIRSVVSLAETGPSELYAGHLPVWQIKFDDAFSSTLYISQTSGEIVTRRHDWWRLFDLFWRLHILDPFEGENISNPWLFAAALIGLFSLLTGLLLSWYSIFRPALRRQTA